jgi:isocitrate lyase
MGTELLAVARTDAEAATLITSTIDPRDHGYILGCTNPSLQPLNDLMIAAASSGKTGAELQEIEDGWTAQAGLKLYADAVADSIRAGAHVDKERLTADFLARAQGKSLAEARSLAKALTGLDVYWDWDVPRTREGYYRLQGGVDCAINRAVAYAPYADALWMESKLPDYEQARRFAAGVHAVWPAQK